MHLAKAVIQRVEIFRGHITGGAWRAMFRRAVWERVLLYSFPVVLVTILSYTGHLENHYLYHPVREITVTPADYGTPFEDVSFQAADGVRLHGWYVRPPAPDRPVLLWAHGNSGNLSHRVGHIAAIHRELRAGVFLFDYRGFGRSEGKPWESGLYDDARAAYAWLAKRVPPERIFVFGRSLGAAVAIRIVSEGAAARGLILESPFETLLAIGKELFPFLPVSWLVSQEFDNARYLPLVRMPVFILHGDADELIPIDHGLRLFALANEPKHFHVIRRSGHNDTWRASGERYWDAWRSFLANPGQDVPKAVDPLGASRDPAPP